MSRDVLTLTRALLTGGEADEFEKVLAEGVGIVRRGTLVHLEGARRRCTLALLSLSDSPLRSLGVSGVSLEVVNILHLHNDKCSE
jgi:hypothetical protein